MEKQGYSLYLIFQEIQGNTEKKGDISMKNKEKDEKQYSLTPEGRENQLISLAMDAAEKQLRDGTASPSVITHFLKQASTRNELEKELIKNQNRLAAAKAEAIDKVSENGDLAREAIEALAGYRSDD